MTRYQPDTRGMSTPLSHVLSVGITTILLVGLVSGAAGFLDSQSERTARQEMDTIANRLASELDQADTLGRQGDNVTLNTTHKQTIAGSTYTAQLADASGDCTATSTSVCLKVAATEYEYKATINVTNETALSLREAESGEFVIRSTGGSANVQAPTRSLDLSARVGIGGDVGAGPPPGVGTALEQKPVPRFTYSPGLPRVDEQMQFDASDSFDPDGNISTYEWDWTSDGSIDDTGVSHPNTFVDPGWKNVTLRVTDDSGSTANYTREVRVAGLEYVSGSLHNVSGTTNSFSFQIRNREGKDIEINRIMIDPANTSLNEIFESNPPGNDLDHDSPHEIEIDLGANGSYEGYVDWRNEVDIPSDGKIIRVDRDGYYRVDWEWYRADYEAMTLNPGQRATVRVRGLNGNVVGEHITFGVRYLVDGSYNAAVFKDKEVDTP